MNDTQSKKMTFMEATALVASGIVGSGLLTISRQLSKFGFWGIVVWPVSALLIYSIFLIFVRISSNIRNKDGKFAEDLIEIINITLGERIGFLLAFGYFVAISASCAFVTNILGDYFSVLFPQYNKIVISSLCLFLIFVLNMVNPKAANKILLLLTIVKLSFFAFIGVAGSTYFNNYELVFSSPLNLISAIPVAIFAFFGFEYAIFSRDSIQNPEKNVYKSTVLGVFLSAIVFVLIHLMVVFTIKDPATSLKPVYDAGCYMFGDLFGLVIVFIGIISCVTTLNGMLLVQGNRMYNTAMIENVPMIYNLKTSQGFAYAGAIVTCLSSIIINILEVPVINYATFLIFIMYAACLAIDIKDKGLDFKNTIAGLSIGIVMYSIFATVELLFFVNVGIIYIIGLILQILNNLKRK